MSVLTQGHGVRDGSRIDAEIIDADVHNAFRDHAHVKRYLPAKWHTEHDQGVHNSGWPGATQTAPRPSTFRNDSFPAAGAAGSDLDLMREQLLDRYKIRKAVLHPILDVMFHAQAGELGLAQAAATNDWMIAEWLERDERLYGAISVPIEDGLRAAREIARAAQHPRFVNVTLTVTTREPLGDAKYWPIYEAAVKHGLPVVIHVGGFGAYGSTFSAAGEPTYYIERHSNWSLVYPQQLVSLIGSGVFAALPELQVVLEEGGIGWLAPLMWRMDRTWSGLGDQLPRLDRRPSAVVREHIWLTTQPLDEPERHADLAKLLDRLDMDERILFSSDYPHHDFDAPSRVLSAREIGAERRRKILTSNAEHVFRFPR
jgi:predicted TIM-barrel fold metal-dependent hydrolase